MDRLGFHIAVTLAIGIAFGFGGFFLGRTAPRRAWEGRKADLEKNIRELHQAKAHYDDIVRKIRIENRKRREKYGYYNNKPKPDKAPMQPTGPTSLPGNLQFVPATPQ